MLEIIGFIVALVGSNSGGVSYFSTLLTLKEPINTFTFCMLREMSHLETQSLYL
jgi:hypothetical protein